MGLMTYLSVKRCDIASIVSFSFKKKWNSKRALKRGYNVLFTQVLLVIFSRR